MIPLSQSPSLGPGPMRDDVKDRIVDGGMLDDVLDVALMEDVLSASAGRAAEDEEE